ncbi:hypothetical protein E2C01_004733 [Portunus trituberculatus]|uniref:Uncharacterized protein n=1 Tax=Portunus trituberculatus TaxID=210409 RepID=A0A5B7CUQ1_PORTR|nr:hypothetical protein [Portunus trituberculatus]
MLHPTSAQDRFMNNGASAIPAHLPELTLDGSCPKLPPCAPSARSASCTLLGAVGFGEIGLELARHSA